MEEQALQPRPAKSDGMITLVAEGRYFRCHKTKLVECSDYFRAMFSNNFRENDKNLIELQDIDADCLELLIQYVELGSYVIPSESILSLLQTSAMLQFSSVQTACEQQTLASLSCNSCLEVYFVTSALGISHLASAALTVATWMFKDLAVSSQFCQLSLSELVEYVSHPAVHPGPGGEWSVWEALVRWIEASEVERARHLVQLLLCLDFHSLTTEDLSNMLFFSIVNENFDAVQVVEYIKRFKKEHQSKTVDRWQYNGEQVVQNAKGNAEELASQEEHDLGSELVEKLRVAVDGVLQRPKRRLPQVPCVVGFKQSQVAQTKQKAKNSDDEDDYSRGLASRIKNMDITPVVFSFDPVHKRILEELTLTKLCDSPVQCSGYQVCAVGPSMYILGGEYQLGHGSWNMSLWRYSTATKKWIIENSLPQPRRHYMSCVIDSTIYLLGGYGRHRIVQNSVDAYDTESGEWIRCPDMPHCVSHGAVCAFKGRVLVFTQEMQLLTYYPTMKKWSAIPIRSPNRLGYRAAVPWKNYIYLIDSCSPQVYKFSPEEERTITHFGLFTAPPVNVCVVDGIMYNFSHDDLSDGRVVEVIDLEMESAHAGQGMDCDKCTSSAQDSRKLCEKCSLKKSDLVHSKEVWRGSDPNSHMFTTKCPAETTVSLGSFPLLKVTV